MSATSDASISLAIVGNALNLAYNVPLVYRVMLVWDADNLSTYFIGMRIAGAIAWIAYGGVEANVWVALSYVVTLMSSLCLAFVKLYPIPPCRRNENVEVARV